MVTRKQLADAERRLLAAQQPKLRPRPDGFDYPELTPAYLRDVCGVIDGLDAARHNIRMAIRMLEVTHKLFPLPTSAYKRLRQHLNAATKELLKQYPVEPCECEVAHTCTVCNGKGYLRAGD